MAELIRLVVDERQRLVLKRDGQEDVVGVRIRRAFPWSQPGRHISIRNAEGKEVLLIDDLATLGEAERRAIEEALGQGCFVPQITRVLEIDTRFEHQQWRVETDRGPVEFRVQEREDIRFLGGGRFTVKDADGNVYELPSLDTLDEQSRRAVEKLV